MRCAIPANLFRGYIQIIVTGKLRLVVLLAVVILTVATSAAHFTPPVVAGPNPIPDSDLHIFTPFIQNQHTPQFPLEWDDRLDERGATFVPAQVSPGQGYWRLTKAAWFDEEESQGRHHILIDIQDISGRRQPGTQILIRWEDDSNTIFSEAKPGEPYAANFPMYAVAPAYGAYPNNGAPADRVDGMGLGDLQHPYWSIHTSYGLTWRWTIAP